MKIGIDLGGSHIAAGLVDDNLNIIYKIDENLNTEEKENLKEKLVPKIEEKINELLKKTGQEKIDMIGIACPRNHKRW